MKKLVTVLLAVSSFAGYADPVAKAVVENDGTVLRFVYDEKTYDGAYSIDDDGRRNPTDAPAWSKQSTRFVKVVFDESFSACRPAHCGMWFGNFSALREVAGMTNLNVSAATSLFSMFTGCAELTSLDLTAFNTSGVKSFMSMFAGCKKLKTIYASDGFVVNGVANFMFRDCTSLCGGMLTRFDGAHIGRDYARIDRGESSPGYFSLPVTPRVVVLDNATRLRFVYDTVCYGEEGRDWFSVASAEALSPFDNPPWYDSCRKTVTAVEFDPSFREYPVKHCGSWFYEFTALASIDGLDCLDTRAATSLAFMFCGCRALTELDLSGFDPVSADDLTGMFQDCSELKTIYASDRFVIGKSASSDRMFADCVSLVGGCGTPYDADMVDKSMARIDDAPGGEPGYFSRAPMAKVVTSDNETALRFVFDTLEYGVEGKDWFPILESDGQGGLPPWSKLKGKIVKVAFDDSFRAYRPFRCDSWFCGMDALMEFVGIENLNVSFSEGMNRMFAGCASLARLDLTGFDTGRVTDMVGMFSNCTSLAAVYVSDRFTIVRLAASADMFAGCASLVGERGTAFGADNPTDATFARVDGGEKSPGYFSRFDMAKVLVEDDGATLRFVCDKVDYSALGVTWYSVAEAEAINPLYGDVPWVDLGGRVVRVVFDESFAKYRPRQCSSWFYGFGQLTTFEGMDFLDTSSVTNAMWMFGLCGGLVSLDLSGFDTSRLEDSSSMFSGCGKLRTIYADDKFVTNRLVGSSGMFKDCNALTGSRGTSYWSARVADASYAHVDRGSSNPGYFSRETVAKALVESDGLALRFVCDDLEHGEKGVDWYAVDDCDPSPDSDPLWAFHSNDVAKVTIDPSFKSCRPVDCHRWFRGFRKIDRIDGLANLDTSESRSFSGLFDGCILLKRLDLSRFDTGRAVCFDRMFAGCAQLETICASSAFVIPSGCTGVAMFGGCTALAGGRGTAYDPAFADCSRARIDRTDSAGYFTSPVAKAVVENGGLTLRFVCDNSDFGTEGVGWFPVAETAAAESVPAWVSALGGTTEKVVFEPSFCDCQPEGCAGWFDGFSRLAAVEGFEYLNTSRVSVMARMFRGCSSLTELDLSSLAFSSVTNMARMFSGCRSLRTISVSESFELPSMPDSFEMFLDCTDLAGGLGTRYDPSLVDAFFARPDGGISSPGYFSLPLAARTVLMDGGTLLRFVHDRGCYGRKGVDWFSVAEAEARRTDYNPPWHDACHTNVTRVVFSGSFADYRPKHCSSWFFDFVALTNVAGIANLNTSEATGMMWMFGNCKSLVSLDLAGLDTSQVTNMFSMFGRARSLRHIYASGSFVTDLVVDSADMFVDCTLLTGGAGTTYDLDRLDKSWARVDGGPDAPGYFTLRERPSGAYEVWTVDNGLSGSDCAWDSHPARWGGIWANAFVYTYGQGLVNGDVQLLTIAFDEKGEPVVGTPPVIEGHEDFTAEVIGSMTLDDWWFAVPLQPVGDCWRLPPGADARFFRLRMTKP